MTNFRSTLKARILGAALLGALAVGGTQAARAADLGGSIKDAPAYQEPERRFSWTGLYLGANVGGAWANGEATYSQAGFGGFSGSGKSSSLIGGGQIGYNWQAGQLVVGIEADIAGQDLGDSRAATNGITTATLSGTSRWVGTVRPRVGYATGNALLYITGGLAYGNVKHNSTETIGAASRTFSESDTRAGWTLGGGIEWALNRNWTIGAEYLHIDLGSTSLNSPAAGVFPASSARFEDREDVIRAKLNYKF
jgi:outer membrane immunogenic protein